MNKVTFAHDISGSGLSTIESDLLTLAQASKTKESIPVKVWISSESSPFLLGRTYNGWLMIESKTTDSLYFSVDFVSYECDRVTVGYNNGTWKVKSSRPIAMSNITSLSLLKSSLLEVADSLASQEEQTVRFVTEFSDDDFINGATYQGNMRIISKSTNFLYFAVTFEGVGSTSVNPIYVMYNNGTWTIKSYAF